MKKLALLFGLTAPLAALVTAGPATALPRTYVSAHGADSGACSRAFPCRTFFHAVNVTDPGGVLSCVDSGNYGVAIISRSITIDCTGSLAGINAAGTTAVTINGAGIIVRLRNLSINGMGTGTAGIRLSNAAALFIENCLIANFNGGAAGDGIGIKLQPPAGVITDLYVLDSSVASNGRAADGGGIVVQPTGTGSARVAIERTRVENNTYGIFANATGGEGTTAMQIRDSVAAASTFDGISAFTAPGGGTASVTVQRTSSLLNGRSGIVAQGETAFVLLADATVSGNATGLSALGGNIISFGTNAVNGNTTDTPATAFRRPL
jgi:hypothetical protein